MKVGHHSIIRIDDRRTLRVRAIPEGREIILYEASFDEVEDSLRSADQLHYQEKFTIDEASSRALIDALRSR